MQFHHQCDEEMMALLTCIVLFLDREEYHETLEYPKEVETLCLRYTTMLQKYLESMQPRGNKFAR